MNRKLYKRMVELTSNPIYTVLLKSFATSRFSKVFIRPFSHSYKIEEGEMASRLQDYKTLNDFFIRKLKEDARPIDQREELIVSPVDAIVSNAGMIDEDARFYIKEKEYSLTKLLGLKNIAKRYIDGTYILFYLSPRDYHRIHSPLEGQIVKRWAIGKYSEPVNQMGLLLGDNPLATNYRLITELELTAKYKQSRLAMVKIGALNVNSIHYSHLKDKLDKGEELAYFTFGSSVILLFEKGSVELLKNVVNEEVKQGQAIARLIKK